MTKILVIGSARHGKDSACEVLQKHDLTFVSASDIALKNIIWPAIGARYSDLETCFKDRVNCRSEWFDLIAEYNQEDPAKLAKLVLFQSDIYCGIRARAEFDAAKSLFDHILWIDRSEKLPCEPETSFELFPLDATIVIDNNQDLQHLNNQIEAFIKGLKK